MSLNIFYQQVHVSVPKHLLLDVNQVFNMELEQRAAHIWELALWEL